jgi:serine protease
MWRMRRAGVIAAVVLALAPPASAAPHPTGRWLVTFEEGGRASAAVLARAGVRRAGPGAPRLRVATVTGSRAVLRRLRRVPGVAAVEREWARELRAVPNDPAPAFAEDEFAVPPGTPLQWALAREGFPAAWDVTTGAGARVAVIDTGIDGTHPDLAGKVASADAAGATDPQSDPDGHGTHVSGLACAATNNGIGIAGAGWDCGLAVVKLGTDPAGGIRDEQIVQGIQLAIQRGAHAVNMSFGGGPPSAALDTAIQAAFDRGIVLVAAASNDPVADQGAPASQLQPGDAPSLDAGRGLVVTSADFFDTRAGTGFGPQVSLAAYGFYDETQGPPGVISTYPGPAVARDVPACMPVLLPSCPRRAIGGDRRYAYLQGTSMATPQVTALAAMVGALNPFLGATDKLRVLKQTARSPAGGWTGDLGWGIVDAGRAVDTARRIDRVAPASAASARRRQRPRRGRRRALVRVRWSGSDPAGAPALLPSGVASADLHLRRGSGRDRRVRAGLAPGLLRLRLRPGVYRLYTRAVDAAGNREAAPARADVRLVVRRAKRKKKRRARDRRRAASVRAAAAPASP